MIIITQSIESVETLEKLERVLKTCGVKVTFIEDEIGIKRNTLYAHREGRMYFKKDTLEKLNKVLDIYNV